MLTRLCCYKTHTLQTVGIVDSALSAMPVKIFMQDSNACKMSETYSRDS